MASNNKILCFTQFDIQRPRTNQLSDMHFCEGFAENGIDIEFVTPGVSRPDNVPKDRINEFYGIHTPFTIKYLPTAAKGDVQGFFLMAWINVLTSWIFLRNSLRSAKNKRLILSRSTAILTPMVFLRKMTPFLKHPRIVLWVHEISLSRKRLLWLYHNVDHILPTNSKMKDDLIEQVGIPREKLHITLNPITSAQAKEYIGQKEAREKIEYSNEKPLIVYTGKLFAGQKEVEFIAEAAKRLPQYQFLLTGGKPEAVAHYKQWCEENAVHNMDFTGYMHDYTMVKYYQAAADVLVSYYTQSEHVVEYNFPQKIVEYMLTGHPIVSPDFPASRDVLKEDNAVFVAPENTDALVAGIVKAVEEEESLKKAERARALALNCTFDVTTGKIIDYLF